MYEKKTHILLYACVEWSKRTLVAPCQISPADAMIGGFQETFVPFRNLTLKELAKMIGADSRRLERMAQRGEIPCQKVGGDFRFNRAEITQWLQQHIGTFHTDHLKEVDAGMTAHRQTQQTKPIITDLIHS